MSKGLTVRGMFQFMSLFPDGCFAWKIGWHVEARRCCVLLPNEISNGWAAMLNAHWSEVLLFHTDKMRLCVQNLGQCGGRNHHLCEYRVVD
jgi:hypothetical protein